MNKTKAFTYPLIFSVGFMVCWKALVAILNATASNDGYGALGIGMSILLVWLTVAIPIYNIRYSKIIADSKISFLFAAYNSLLTVVFHKMPFSLEGETTIVVTFTVWVVFWNTVPLICRLISRKIKSKATEEEAE